MVLKIYKAEVLFDFFINYVASISSLNLFQLLCSFVPLLRLWFSQRQFTRWGQYHLVFFGAHNRILHEIVFIIQVLVFLNLNINITWVLNVHSIIDLPWLLILLLTFFFFICWNLVLQLICNIHNKL